MHEKLIYRNHLNEELAFGSSGLLAGKSGLHDYAWTAVQKNDRISGFKRGVSSFQLPVTALTIERRNRLLEVTEKDVLANIPGRLYCGEYYLQCFVTAGKKDRYFRRNCMEETLTVTTDKAYWVRETPLSFRKTGKAGGLDWPTDFSFDFTPDTTKAGLFNPDFLASNFRLVLYGPCTSPSVSIGGHVYALQASAEAGEYITIDSIEKTITKVLASGDRENLFDARNRDSYIFQRIPSGRSSVAWSGDYGVDLILLEERSEPKWT